MGQFDSNISLDSTTIEDKVREAIMEEESVQFDLKFIKCTQYATGKIQNSCMKIQLPNPPSKEVTHEMLGVGLFVTTHPFGRMAHIRKGTRS